MVIVLEEIHSDRLDHLTTERESEKLREGFSSGGERNFQVVSYNKMKPIELELKKANFVTTSKQCGYK